MRGFVRKFCLWLLLGAKSAQASHPQECSEPAVTRKVGTFSVLVIKAFLFFPASFCSFPVSLLTDTGHAPSLHKYTFFFNIHKHRYSFLQKVETGRAPCRKQTSSSKGSCPHINSIHLTQKQSINVFASLKVPNNG